MVVVAYGRSFPRSSGHPARGCVNVHASSFRNSGERHRLRGRSWRRNPDGCNHYAYGCRYGYGADPADGSNDVAESDTLGTLHDRLARMGRTCWWRPSTDWKRARSPRSRRTPLCHLRPENSKRGGTNKLANAGSSAFQPRASIRPWPGAFTVWVGRLLKLFSAEDFGRRCREAPARWLKLRL